MFQKLIKFSVFNPSLVIVLAGVLVAYAGANLQEVPVDVFPELNAPTVVIMSESPGLAADEVESFVSFPIESAVNGLPGVRRVRSSSAISLSIVWVEFDFDYDIYKARQLVAERLTNVEESLPDGVHAEIAPISGIAGEIMLISVQSPDKTVSELELRAWSEFELRNRLLAVSGISQVVAIGGELPEYQINVDQDRLRLYGLTIKDVADSAGEAHTTASAGYLVNYEGKELPLRQTGRVKSVNDIRKTVVGWHEGRSVLLEQVADVEFQGALKRGTAAESGKDAVVLSIQKSPGQNTLKLTEEIDKALDQAETSAPKGVVINRHVMRQSDFIGLSVNNVLTVLRDAAILVAIILILFLMNVRTTLITLTALPLSLAVAVLMLWWLDLGINVMTLGGLAVAVGELVDDAIIDVENVYRRLRENSILPPDKRMDVPNVVIGASNEIRGSIVFATVIIVMVFVPLLFLQGLEGRFFRPLGLAYIIAILASLVVAVTVTPALCRLILRGGGKKGAHKESFVSRMMKRVYEPTLKLSIKLRWAVLALALAATLGSLWVANSFGTRFLPDFNEGTFTVFLMAPPGTSLDESDRLARGVETRLTKIEGVRSVVRRTGRAERDEHAEPVSSSEIEVSVKPGFSKNEVRAEIDDILKDVPGITTMIGQPIEHRLSHVLSGTPAAIAINVYGDDLPTLRKIAKEVEAELKQIPGARDVAANREVMVETLPIRYRHHDLARYGLTPASAAAQVEAAFNGVTVADVNDGTRLYRMVVRLSPEQRENPEQVKNLILVGKGGAKVRLKDVANIAPEMASNLIARENASRKAVISCNVAEGENLGDLVEKVRSRVDPIVAKHGYSVHYGGQFEAQQSASRTIYLMGAGVVLGIFLLLVLAVKSVRAALLVMVNLPLALIGGIAAIWISESPDPIGNVAGLFGFGGQTFIAPVISIASMVGFITLFGIAVRNGILLVSHYQDLQHKEGKSLRDAIIQGSSERLIPILMTALTAVLGLIPLAMGAGEPGSEILAPLAVVVLGGLLTSTLLNLIVVPAGYAIVGKETETKERKYEENNDDSGGAV